MFVAPTASATTAVLVALVVPVALIVIVAWSAVVASPVAGAQPDHRRPGSPMAGGMAAGMAVAPVPQFEQVAVDIGGAAQRIRSLETDDQGFVWLATPAGLVRWDGSTSEVFTADVGSRLRLPHFVVTDVADAPGPPVWAAAGTLLRVDPDRLEVLDTAVPADQIASTQEGVWALSDSGLRRFDPTAGESTVISATGFRRLDGYRNLLEVDGDGRVYVTTEWGVQVFGDELDRRLVIPGGVRGIAGDETIWVTSADAVWAIDPERAGQPRRLATIAEMTGGSRAEIGEGLVEHQGNLWIGLANGDVVTYSLVEGTAVVIPADSAWGRTDGHRAIGLTPTGEILVAASGVGLFSSVEAASQVVRLDWPAGTLSVSDLLFDQNQLWLATKEDGLVAIDPTEDTWTEVSRYPIWASAGTRELVGVAARPGGFWLGSADAGLFSFDPESDDLAPVMGTGTAPIRAIAGTDDGGIVVAMLGVGVRQFDARGQLIFEVDAADRPGQPHQIPGFVKARPGGGIWVGGEHGLDLIEPEIGESRHWSTADGLVGDEVFDLYEDGQGFAWLGTSAGIERLNLESGNLVHFGSEAGLPPGEASLVLPHARRDALWVGTSAGLALFDLREQASSLHIDPGIDANARYLDGVVLDDGTSLVLTTDGLLRIAADFPGTRRLAQKARIVALSIDGEPAPLTDAVSIDESSTVSFEVAYGEYRQPGSLSFAYRLVGHEEAWNDLLTSERSITYTNLDPGRYQLMVQARTADGTSQVDSYEFTVDRRIPAWVILAATGLMGAVALGFVLSIRKSRRSSRRAAELESLVAERTHRLVEAASEAARANDSKSQFLAMISHELRTPLNAMMGFTDLIAQHADGEQVPRWASRAQEASEQLESMVEELLFVARQGDFHDDVVERPRDLQRLVDSAVGLVHSEANSAMPPTGIQVRAEGTYFVSESRVMQVLINLLTNAVRYGEGNPVLVEVDVDQGSHSTETAHRGEELVRFSVTDWGPGIDEEEIENLMLPFSRGPGVGAGLGLGLTICTQILERLGSQLQVSTGSDGSTRFWFELWLRPLKDPKSGEPNSDLRTPSEPIIVVDDDPHCRQLLLDTLEASGFHPIAASSGPEALALLETVSPLVLVTDHLMPGMNGATLARQMQSAIEGSPVPVICVTALPDDASTWSEYDHILAKPYRPKDLVGTIGEILEPTL